MIFIGLVLCVVLAIFFPNSDKLKSARVVVLSVSLPLMLVFVGILYGFSLTAAKSTVSDQKNFTQEAVTKVVSITHTMGDGKYIVELDKGAYKTSQEYDVYEESPILKDSPDKFVEEGFSKLPSMNWVTPWEYHRPHVDIIHFPASEIKVVP